jgi:hypothetical protein
VGGAATGSGALLAALERVPDGPAAHEGTVSWLDQAALVAARPGAAQPDSFAELDALLAADDPSAHLWVAALMGASSGDMELLSLLQGAARWPEELGFDLLDIHQHLVFGAPPSNGTVLMGDFDPALIASAHAGRGYTASQSGSRTLLCGATGCENGQQVDLANADSGLPFGGRLGRSEPLAVSDRDILVSPAIETVTGMVDAADGTEDSLDEEPAYRAVATAADPDLALIQATLLPGGMPGGAPEVLGLFSGTPEEARDRIAGLSEILEPMPQAQVIGILDGATQTEQVVTIALAYADEADATVAADVLPRRLQTLPSLSMAPLSELLSDRGVTSVTSRVVPAGDGMTAAAVVEVRAPLASAEPDGDTGRPEASSRLYRLFVDLVYRRDLLWLVPSLPLG